MRETSHKALEHVAKEFGVGCGMGLPWSPLKQSRVRG